jgi:protein-tyrosine phosphatase
VGVNVAYGSFPFIRAPRSVGTVGRVANDALMVPERRIVLDNVHNFRDLGGYSTTDGRSIRWRMLFRADGLAGMSAADLEVMRELGLRTVIDLRSNKELDERGRFPHEDVPVSYHHFSVIDTTWTEDTERVVPDDEAEWLTWAYEQMLDRGAPRFADALRVLAEAEVYPAVFHCAAGKDRTGLLAALLLGSLGVAHDHIVEDYALTQATMDRFLAVAATEDPEAAQAIADTPATFFMADPAAMALVLTDLERDHGSIPAYVRTLGVTDDQLAHLQDLLLTTN